MTLLEKCNADGFKAILEVKEQSPEIGEKLFAILQAHKSPFDLTGSDMLWFSAHLSHQIWNGKVYTFYSLFKSQQTTPKQ